MLWCVYIVQSTAWLIVNKLSLNIPKTKYIVFHSKQKRIIPPKLKIQNVVIDRVQDFNFLGLILNENLSWKAIVIKKQTGSRNL